MKKPAIRVTKWLADIPVEAICSACPQISFRAQGSRHRPNREEYQRSLQLQFRAHCETEHALPKPALNKTASAKPEH